MEDITILTDEHGETARLTTAGSQSPVAILVLRIESGDISGDLGPADEVERENGVRFTMAEVVAGWARQEGRTLEEVEAASLFLKQWPEGPQV
jgi:hypothetical protein